MFSRLKPFPMIASKSVPSTARQIAPSPPRMLVPPTTAAEMAVSSMPLPRSA